MPNRSHTYWRTTFQFQLARSIPAWAGASCTTAFKSNCCSPLSAGEPPDCSKDNAGDRPLQRRRPNYQWYGNPAPVPQPLPMPSNPGAAAIGRAISPAPEVSAPSPKAPTQLPMVWESCSSASATADAVQPWCSSHRACHLSRSRGVGARCIRRRTSPASICHRSKNPAISFMPNTNPTVLPYRLA